MFFNTHNAEKIAVKAEQKLRKELGAATAIPYAIKNGNDKAGFYIDFDLPANHSTQLRAVFIKNGLIGGMIAELFYSAQISKTVANYVHLEMEGNSLPRRVVGFAGDATASGKLNANRELFKRAVKFTRDMDTIGTFLARIQSRFEIVPQPVGSILSVYTLVKSGWFGGSFDAKEFLDIAAMVEKPLSH